MTARSRARHISPSVPASLTDADDPRRLDPRVLRRGLLHLWRADIRPVMNDDVLLAAAEPKVAAFVNPHHVARTDVFHALRELSPGK